jgi:ribosomal-protein-alanine N-acetyltransferase
MSRHRPDPKKGELSRIMGADLSPLEFLPLADAADLDWCARLMAESEPWLTLGRDYQGSQAVLTNPIKERYLVRRDGVRVGFLILDLSGPFKGYIQTICIAPEIRGQGLGSKVIEWAEARIFRDSPNVFMCVSSFNLGARRLYARLGFEVVGSLRDYVVAGYDELLLRKTRGPLIRSAGAQPPA